MHRVGFDLLGGHFGRGLTSGCSSVLAAKVAHSAHRAQVFPVWPVSCLTTDNCHRFTMTHGISYEVLPQKGVPRCGGGGGGRKQVNKALHTCTSWYAYAAMFGSSIDTMGPRARQRMYRLHLCLPSYRLLAVFCRPKPLACMSRYGGLRSTGGWTGLQYAGTQSANLSLRGGGGYRGQNPKNHWGIIFGPKMMILQGVRR